MEAGNVKRMNLYDEGMHIVEKILHLENHIRNCGLEMSLVHIIKLRASQLNGCQYCMEMHTHESLKEGETQERLSALPEWRHSDLFTDREKAALTWTEALTNIQDGHASDEAYIAVSEHFDGETLADLTLAVVTINAWNRLGIGFRAVYTVPAES